ncbi:MAG: hypothetical protein LH629_15235, partial [Ignavibacteria bacterium]|nr:hypothetical protein [Ignavibacteria bacterium]
MRISFSILLFSISYLFPHLTFAQTFYKTYNNNTYGSSLIYTPDNNLIISGDKSDSAMIMKTDLSGTVIWVRTFKPSNINFKFYVTSLEITPDNFIIGTGGSLSPAFIPDHMFYFKCDLNGNILFCKEINNAGHHFTMRHILPLSNLVYTIVAAHEPFAGSFSDPMIIKVNAIDGSIISESPRYDYENVYIDDISESILTSDKKFIYSTGRLYVAGATPDQMRIFVTKFDTVGNDFPGLGINAGTFFSFQDVSTGLLKFFKFQNPLPNIPQNGILF